MRIFYPVLNFVVLLVLIFSGAAFAAEEARILPQSISRVRFVGVYARELNRKFNNSGELGTLGGANRTVTIRDMAKQNPQLADLVNGLNGIQSGLGDNLYTGNLYQDISMQQSIYGTCFEYGLSKRWNLGVRLRVVERNLRTNFRAEGVNNAPKIAQALQTNGNPPETLIKGLNQVGSFDTAFWENTLFASKGYEIPSDYSKTELGYTEFGGKYLFHQDDFFISSVLAGIRAPTGKDESLTNPLDQGTGGNYWGVGLQFLNDVQLSSLFSIGTSAKYEYYFSDTKTKAVPKDADDALPSLLPGDGQVQEVKRNIGPRFDGEVSLTTYIPGNAVSFWGAYQYTRKGTDKFSGPGNLYYDGLSRNTKFTANALEGGIEYSTIHRYRQGKFFLPMVIGALYNTTISGTNTPDARFARVDLKFYF